MLGPNVPPEQRLAHFRQLFQNDFDVPGLARFALGRYWRDYNPQQSRNSCGCSRNTPLSPIASG